MRAIIFSRVSTDKQSLDSQTVELYKEAHRQGYKDKNIIPIEYKESGINLNEEERRGIEHLKEAIESNKDVDCLICWELSRVARRADIIYSIRDLLLKNKIRWIVMTPYMELINKEGKQDQTANLMLGIFTSFAESEMQIKKERMKRGKEILKKQGKYIGGPVLTGYRVEDGNFVIDDIGAGLVKKIFTLYSTGEWSLRKLSKELKEEGFFKNAHLYSIHQMINKILNDERYYGSVAGYDAIIPESLFKKCVQVKCDHLIKTKTSNKNLSLGKSLLYDTSGRTLLLYKEQYKVHQDYGPTVSILKKHIDPFIFSFTQKIVNEQLMNKDKRKEQFEYSFQLLMRKKGTYMREKKEVEVKMDRVEERYVEGKINKDKADEMRDKYKKELYEIKKRIDEIDYRIEEENKSYNSIDGVDMTKLEFDDVVSYIRLIIEKIIIYKDKPLKRETHVDVYCKTDGMVYKYILNTNTGIFLEI